jgi:hypothetical protein
MLNNIFNNIFYSILFIREKRYQHIHINDPASLARNNTERPYSTHVIASISEEKVYLRSKPPEASMRSRCLPGGLDTRDFNIMKLRCQFSIEIVQFSRLALY